MESAAITSTLAQYHSDLEEAKRRNDKIQDNAKKAIRKLTNVDNFLDELWHRVDNKELSKMVTELRDAINLLNSTATMPK